MSRRSQEQDRFEKMTEAELEAELKRIEARSKERELQPSRRLFGSRQLSIPEATIIVAVLGFFGTAVGSYLQIGNEFRLKQREIEAQLLIDALSADDPSQALGRVSFLIDTGMVEDEDGHITDLILSRKYGDVTAPSERAVL